MDEDDAENYSREDVVEYYACDFTLEKTRVSSIANDADIIFAGEFHNMQKCYDAHASILSLYFTNYNEQKSRQFEKGNDLYKDIPDRCLEQYVMTKYVKKLVDARKKKDSKLFELIKEDFLRFSKGSPVAEDVSRLCGYVKEMSELRKKGKQFRIVRSYIKKMVAIKSEQFERAARMRDKIKQLTGTQELKKEE